MKGMLFKKICLFFEQAEQNKRLAAKVDELQKLADERLDTIRFLETRLIAEQNDAKRRRRARLACAMIKAGREDFEKLDEIERLIEQRNEAETKI